MTKENQDIELWAGDTRTETVTVTNSAGSAQNLTGLTLRWVVRRHSRAGTIVISKSTGSGITITNAAGGIFQIALSPADTKNLEGEYYHEASGVDSGGNVSTLLIGTLTVNKSAVVEP